MNLYIDDKNKDISIINKTDYNFIDKSNIVNININSSNTVINIICSIISDIYKLNNEDKFVLNFIIDNNNIINKIELRKKYTIARSKTNVTFERSIRNLISKGLIIIDYKDNIKLSNNIIQLMNLKYRNHIIINL